MENSRNKILIVEDESNMRKVLKAFLNQDGYSVTEASNGLEAQEQLAHGAFQAVITDQKMPRMDGLSLLAHCMDQYPGIPVILITAHGTIETAVKAMKNGAFDYITKPFEETELLAVVEKAIAISVKNGKEPAISSVDLPNYGMVGNGPEMKKIFRIIDKVADSPSTVLLIGETGTGKELISRAIHNLSGRKEKPFIAINCGAIPENLIESELFGYERGAFSGAVTSKPGRFELADGGTLFLDEIGELRKEVQAKLLRALQTQAFERIGGTRTIQVDVRLIAATNVDLAAEVDEGRFRKDLYYRLNVVRIDVPPLRSRLHDIPTLARYFLEMYNHKLGKKARTLSDEAMQALLIHSYPGNIRELENIIERAVLLTDGEMIGVSDLPLEFTGVAKSGKGTDLKAKGKAAASQTEKAMIIKTLEDTGGNVTHAAKELGMSRRGLQLKMKEYELRTPGTRIRKEGHDD